MLSFYIIGSYFSISGIIKLIDFIYSGFFHIPLVLLVYINIGYLVPNFLQKEKYVSFILLSTLNIGLAYIIHELLFEILIPLIPGEFFGVFYIVSFTDSRVLVFIFGFYLVISTLLKLSKSWYELQQLEKEKLSLELNSLKMQINPHFLFNSLNSLYSLARKKSDKTPIAIMHLSNLMRYMIYEVSEEVILSKEIEILRDYLNLQMLRTEEDVNISFQIEGDTEHRMIAPLLFFPLVENSFKHGLKGEKGTNFVEIILKNSTSNLFFHIRNNKSSLDFDEDGKYGGIGIANVKKRLHLIYGNHAKMKVKETDESFEVTIKINWND
jgi:LytS/YehU family sensor histidine kinase